MQASFDERRYLIPFRAVLLPQIFTDVLVIGAGVAGLRAALAAAEHSDVIVLAKGELQQSNTSWAQGGIAVVLDEADSFDDHVQNTLDAGAGLCDVATVRHIVEAGPQRVRELIDWGIHLDRNPEGELALGREGGHTAHRIVHSHGDATGRELSDTLIRLTRRHERIRLFDNCFALDLITESGGVNARCVGAITHHPKHGLQVIWAKATILASGGCGKVYRETTNAPPATGDGHAMAYRAGVRLADMEFEQFHPTTLYIAGATRALITEAVRGEGAYLVNRNGYRFMKDEHELAELAPRDVVARAILKQVAGTADTHVYLDARHIGDEFEQRFPGIHKLLQKFELDAAKDLIPVRPAMHYMVGGVVVDEQARTNVPGLYAAGEVTTTGLHGANRLASNSLLEGLVCGEIAGRMCMETVQEPMNLPIKVISDIPISDRSELDIADVRSSLRSVMWRHVGIERDHPRLKEVAEMIDFWARYTLDKIFDERDGWELQNALLVGALITRAAAWRNESRGTHFRNDFPEPNEDLRVHAVWQTGSPEPTLRPVASAVDAAAGNA